MSSTDQGGGKRPLPTKRPAMRTYKEFVDLATSCANSARFSTNLAVAYQFWQMATEYQESAAKRGCGLPYPPPTLGRRR